MPYIVVVVVVVVVGGSLFSLSIKLNFRAKTRSADRDDDLYARVNNKHL